MIQYNMWIRQGICHTMNLYFSLARMLLKNIKHEADPTPSKSSSSSSSSSSKSSSSSSGSSKSSSSGTVVLVDPLVGVIFDVSSSEAAYWLNSGCVRLDDGGEFVFGNIINTSKYADKINIAAGSNVTVTNQKDRKIGTIHSDSIGNITGSGTTYKINDKDLESINKKLMEISKALGKDGKLSNDKIIDYEKYLNSLKTDSEKKYFINVLNTNGKLTATLNTKTNKYEIKNKGISDPEADLPGGKFKTADEAAKNFAFNYYDITEYIRFEISAMIYMVFEETDEGTKIYYSYTKPIVPPRI